MSSFESFNKENKLNNNIDIDAKLNNIIKSCHDKLYKVGISGTKALNDIMNIFILILLEYVFKNNPKKLDELIKIKKLKSLLNKDEIEEYKSYLIDINKFITEFDKKCDFSDKWNDYLKLFLASLFPSLYDKDDTKFNCKEERIITYVFKTIASLSNDINDKFIDDLAIKHGNIYEYFIGYCGKTENCKAFGQFFTPKPFINVILNDCGFKDMINNLEITNPTLYDPAMGSGGLLGLTYITCKDKINPNNIYGCEIEKDTMRYGESSILITTKIFNNNLIRCNTLDRNQNPYLRDNKKFDIIISNPPFGTKTNNKDLIPDDEKHNKKYKDDIYPIQTNGEKLFIQNIIYLLNDGGICALILPDGELMTRNDTNKLVRKFIIDNCKIIKIVDVDNGVFKHTNIKTKVLIFKKEKTKNYNYEIDYLNINKKYEVKFIEKFKLNENYQFSIKTNYEDLIINNKDVEIKTLDEVCEINYGTRIVKSKTELGDYKVYGSGDATFTTNTYNREGFNILIGRFALSENCIRLINEKIFLNDSGLTIKPKKENELIYKYLGYYMLNNQNIIYNIARGAAQKNLDIEEFKNIKIPIPSLKNQEKIIKKIEDIDNLINTRKNLNENFIKEKELLKKMINNKISNCNIKTLDEIFNCKMGRFNSNDMDNNGIIPFYSCKSNNPVGFHSVHSFDYPEYLLLVCAGGSQNNIIGEDVGLGKCYYVKGKTACRANVCSLIPINDFYNIKYINYYLNINRIKTNLKAHFTTNLGTISLEDIKNIKIPIPSLEKQEQYIKDVEELNTKFDKLKEDNNNIINNLEICKKELFNFQLEK